MNISVTEDINGQKYVRAEQEPKTERIEYGTDGNSYILSMSNGKEFEQEPTGDLISRQVVKDKYRERLINSLKDNDRGIDLSKYAEEPYKAFCEFMDSIPRESEEV